MNTHKTTDFYDALANHYHLFFRDWQAHMEREGLALRAVFRGHHVQRVLDAACGSGMQSVALARLGYDVVAADPSLGMLRQAQQNAQRYQASSHLQLVNADFDQLPNAVSGPFDALVCKDNALAHLLTDQEIEHALLGFYELLRPGGLLVIGLKDFSSFMEHRPRFLPGVSQMDDEGHEVISFELWEWQEGPPMIATQHLYLIQGQAPHLETLKHSLTFRPLSLDEVKVVLSELGYEDVREQFDRQQQLIIARRPAAD